ncbi:MAG: hypothetical protein MEQ07_07760 [Aquimonas sp.]|nr:hypothetical protein [Aquimonas sp.]
MLFASNNEAKGQGKKESCAHRVPRHTDRKRLRFPQTRDESADKQHRGKRSRNTVRQGAPY